MKNTFLVILFFLSTTLIAQNLVRINKGNDTITCRNTSTTLTANFINATPAGTDQYTLQTITSPIPSAATGTNVAWQNTGGLTPDDQQQGPFNIGFDFCFYGNRYTQFYINTNGYITFTNLATTNWGANQTSFPTSAAGYPTNAIMAAYTDWDLTANGSVSYSTTGAVGTRKLLVNFVNVPMRGCPNVRGTFQIVLYETTNIIEQYIIAKPTPCAGATVTQASQGIHNSTGTAAVMVTGRNAENYTVNTTQGYRYTPAGAVNYTIAWYNNGSLIPGANALTYTTPTIPATTIFSVEITAPSCGQPIVLKDTIKVIILPFKAAMVTAEMRCHNDNNASIAIAGQEVPNGNGGLAAYSYTWYTTHPYQMIGAAGNPITIPSIKTNLGADTFYIIVKNKFGCDTTYADTIINPPIIQVNAILRDNNSCSPTTCNGRVIVAPTGGWGRRNWIIKWDNAIISNQIRDTIENLCAGQHILKVTDSLGCSAQTTITLSSQNLVLNVNTTILPSSCSGGPCIGKATVTATNGNRPYTYAWTGTSPLISDSTTAVNLCSTGSYSVRITDSLGCQSNSINLAIPNLTSTPLLTIATTQSTCPGGNCIGTATVEVTNARNPLTYLWTGVAALDNDSNATNLCGGGNYTVKVVDSLNCISANTAVTITDVLAKITTNAILTPTSCPTGRCIGRIELTPTNGLAPYRYAWSANAATGNRNTANNLCDDTYTITITDTNGCTGDTTYTVDTAYSIIRLNANHTNTSCAGGNCIGTAAVTVVGGVFPYRYIWSANANTGNRLNATALCAGNYTVSILDTNNCPSNTETITIDNNYTLQGTITNTTIDCNGNCNATITANPTNGVSPYRYTWNVVGTTNSLTNQCAGNYNVTIKDTNNCTLQLTKTVTQPDILTTNPVLQDASCVYNCDGSIDLNITGGTGNYIFNATPANSLTQELNQGLCYGNYSVIITDQSGCSTTVNTMNINFNPSPIASFTYSPAEDDIDLSNPIVTFTDGSLGANQWNWTFSDQAGSTSQNPTYTFPGDGTYTITLIAQNQFTCTDTAVQIIRIVDKFAMWFPNIFTPDNDGINDNFGPKGFSFKPATFFMEIFDRWGVSVYQTNNITKQWDGKINGKEAPIDGYTYKATVNSISDDVYNYQGKITLVR